ncbi:MAG: diguanylate cyclase [Dehalococcoidia bacterium]
MLTFWQRLVNREGVLERIEVFALAFLWLATIVVIPVDGLLLNGTIGSLEGDLASTSGPIAFVLGLALVNVLYAYTLERRKTIRQRDGMHLTTRWLATSTRDASTGLFSHRYFQERLDAELTQGAAQGTPSTLMALKIDHYDDLREVHGEFKARQARAIVVQVLQTLRVSDVPTVDGDTFLILLPNTDCDTAAAAWRRLDALLREKAAAYQEPSYAGLTVSGGVAQLRDGEAGQNLVRDALVALENAASQGGGKLVRFPADNAPAPPLLSRVSADQAGP